MPSTHSLSRRTVLGMCAGFAADSLFTPAIRADIDPDWTTPMPPFRIAGNLYYVGSRDLASYLIHSKQGHILINSNLVTSPPQIKASVEKLGFRFGDVKILLISHGHYDHCAGSAAIKQMTGAKYMVMAADVPVVESGGRTDFRYAHDTSMYFPPAKVDRALHDADTVQLDSVTLTAHKTAGHTKGCTTWTMKVSQNGHTYNVVIVGSPNVNSGYQLIHNNEYPQIATDYAQGFRTLKSLPCDIFLGAHGGYFDMLEKYKKLQAGDADAFLDPVGYKAYVAEREQAFEAELARQKAASANPGRAKS